MLDDELLARVRDVQAAVAELARGPHELADAFRAHAEHIDVDALVEVGQTEPLRLALVERWRQRGPDIGSDQPDEVPASQWVLRRTRLTLNGLVRYIPDRKTQTAHS